MKRVIQFQREVRVIDGCRVHQLAEGGHNRGRVGHACRCTGIGSQGGGGGGAGRIRAASGGERSSRLNQRPTGD